MVLPALVCTLGHMMFLAGDPMSVVWNGRDHVGGSKFRGVVRGLFSMCEWYGRWVV